MDPSGVMTPMQVGQPIDQDGVFCPYSAVVKFPYLHLYGNHKKAVADGFFARGAFKARGWTIFYIRTLLDKSTKPLLLVLELEVVALFADITAALNIELSFPEESGYRLQFSIDSNLRPRYLGQLTASNSIQELEALIPIHEGPSSAPELQDPSLLRAFSSMMSLAMEVSKKKSSGLQDKQAAARNRCQAELDRVQGYLGLAEVTDANVYSAGPPGAAILATEGHCSIASKSAEPSLSRLLLGPRSFDRSVVFVCIDVESWEFDKNIITEIGVCTLDSQDLVERSPGQGGSDWYRRLRCRHFRIAEHRHRNNRKFVQGCADRFEKTFGTSEWISIHDAPHVVASCFKEPFSKPGLYDPYPTTLQDNQYSKGHGLNGRSEAQAPKRNIVFVGQAPQNDIDYLRQIGYDIRNLSNLVDVIDTANMYRAWKQDKNSRSLATILSALELTPWNLHNAGNDAAYTMQALIGIALTVSEKAIAMKLTAEPEDDTATEPVQNRESHHAQQRPPSITNTAIKTQSSEAEPTDMTGGAAYVDKSCAPESGSQKSNEHGEGSGNGRGRGRDRGTRRGRPHFHRDGRTQPRGSFRAGYEHSGRQEAQSAPSEARHGQNLNIHTVRTHGALRNAWTPRGYRGDRNTMDPGAEIRAFANHNQSQSRGSSIRRGRAGRRLVVTPNDTATTESQMAQLTLS